MRLAGGPPSRSAESYPPLCGLGSRRPLGGRRRCVVRLGTRSLGSNAEWVGRTRTEWGKGAPRCVKQLVSREHGWILRVGGVRRGRWPRLGWRGGFDPVQLPRLLRYLAILKSMCFLQTKEATHQNSIFVRDAHVAEGRIIRRFNSAPALAAVRGKAVLDPFTQ